MGSTDNGAGLGMKIVITPDKFKGSLPATRVTAAVAAGLRAGPAAPPSGQMIACDRLAEAVAPA
jgi:hypothetical protein